VFGDAMVDGKAVVSDDAVVEGKAQVRGNAQVSGNAKVFGGAQVSGNTKVFGDAQVSDGAQLFDAKVGGNAAGNGQTVVSHGIRNDPRQGPAAMNGTETPNPVGVLEGSMAAKKDTTGRENDPFADFRSRVTETSARSDKGAFER